MPTSSFLAGIERHKRGQNAIYPPTGHDIPPPDNRGASEAIGWFLDNFSPRELERFIARGSQTPIWDMLCAVGGLDRGLLDHRLRSVAADGIEADPGVLASLGVVASGFALALFLFYLVRIGPARRLASGAIPGEVVRTHLVDCRRGSI